MIKIFATDVVVSKGANNAPALKFSEKGDYVRFRIGAKIYDARAEKNHRWINLTVKAFGPLAERVRKMDLKEGSHINLSGRFDEDSWEDEQTNTKKSMSVIIVDEIEFSNSGGKNAGDGNRATTDSRNSAYHADPAGANANIGGFTGFQPFGGGGSFFNT